MIDMRRNIDVFVCTPDVGISANLSSVFIAFEQMDPKTLKGKETAHVVAMTTSDAMQLLRGLQYMQTRFDLPNADEDPTEVTESPTGKH